jgi:signal-transduction protein with cAMP-binding, CBS, and nucleotidyltransferase domain
MKNGEVPTQPFIRIDRSASIQDAAHLMCDMSMGAIGVDDPDGVFLGLVTERDMLWAVARGKDPSTTRLSDIVNDFPIVLEGPLTADAAARKMRQGHVRHLIVRQEGDLRIVSMRDLLVHYLEVSGLEGSPHLASLYEMYRMFGDAFHPPVASTRT